LADVATFEKLDKVKSMIKRSFYHNSLAKNVSPDFFHLLGDEINLKILDIDMWCKARVASGLLACLNGKDITAKITTLMTIRDIQRALGTKWNSVLSNTLCTDGSWIRERKLAAGGIAFNNAPMRYHQPVNRFTVIDQSNLLTSSAQASFYKVLCQRKLRTSKSRPIESHDQRLARSKGQI